MGLPLPPRPVVGDPAAMEALARLLRARAEDVGSASRGVVHRADSMTFLGPAATAFRARAHDLHARSTAVANQAEDLGVALLRAASAAEEAISQWERYVQQLRDLQDRRES